MLGYAHLHRIDGEKRKPFLANLFQASSIQAQEGLGSLILFNRTIEPAVAVAETPDEILAAANNFETDRSEALSAIYRKRHSGQEAQVGRSAVNVQIVGAEGTQPGEAPAAEAPAAEAPAAEAGSTETGAGAQAAQGEGQQAEAGSTETGAGAQAAQGEGQQAETQQPTEPAAATSRRRGSGS